MVELAMALFAIITGITVLVGPRVEMLFSPALAYPLLLWGVGMLLGVLSNWAPLKMASALGMLGARIYMMTMRLQQDWRDTAWVPHFIAALLCAWVFQRVLCQERARWEFARAHRRRQSDGRNDARNDALPDSGAEVYNG